MTQPLPVIIVGAGMAAYGVAREFRKLDKTTALLIVSSDQAGAYAKPMLSNALAMGKDAAQLLSHSAAQMAATLDATIVGGVDITTIDPAARTIGSADGRSFAYRDLVLALGASPIRLPLGGDGAAAVLSVNHLDDYALLRTALAGLGRPARVTILGAGLIGCEFADDLVAGGHQVTLVDPHPRPLAALAAPALSAALVAAWAPLPITLKLGTTASVVRRQGAALVVELADGSAVDADIVLSAVGLRPAIALAQSAGLATARGIVIDPFGRTSAAHVYALGDCAEYRTGAGGGAVMPYVAPLLLAARAIGATLAGTPTPIVLRNDAVVVKTASLKLALAPPPAGSTGAWIHVDDGERIVARFVDGAGIVRGFGLSLHTPALRNALMAELDQAHQGAGAQG
ncbi:NAD(P)/FAD-dependent oxidoreductase [Massilia sp. DWR3-1-1]|uniref:NAD(P)/FAD-dependent oxidoreductase n=1 Tax=Massilia sp. DWR3-1-1 TaxID=2804559 RepID=UPI003CEF5B84